MRAIRYLALAAVIALVASGAAASGGSIEARFALFKTKYGRHYATPEEERKRMAIYAANLRRAGELQLRNPLAAFGENAFADVSPEEFKSHHNAEKMIRYMFDNATAAPKYTKQQLAEMPRRIDWREHGAVTPVKNQGDCGSCWAFSVTGNVEGQWFKTGHNLTSLSEQELVSCYRYYGCEGGFTGGAMEWIVQHRAGWLTSEHDYPYVSGANGSNPACEAKPRVARIYGHHAIEDDEHQMAAYLAEHGPLSICVDADTWQNYVGGIMQHCPITDIDHAVLAVGYNLDAATPYWIVKNSWAADWGEHGYVFLEFGTNQCAIKSTPRNALVHDRA